MAKISFSNDQARVTVPREIIEAKGWNESTEVSVQADSISGKITKDSEVRIVEVTKGGKK